MAMDRVLAYIILECVLLYVECVLSLRRMYSHVRMLDMCMKELQQLRCTWNLFSRTQNVFSYRWRLRWR
jgi:hypothetical protein